ncbi:Putative tail or base plate protein gp19, Bacteriophage [Enterococcus casseliflavus]|uniref:hypothetical protein n=1 Tax=Enterococcus casseliflavus TaxID=37734 RepID=UPI000DFA1FB8|nr:hypothetical protein [Enterococcus casseliflavus]GEB30166.1 hypothetical protein ECA02_32610 [Enterococcus casseliflavus]STP33077.1 Putative tail or base plate protein gp19, Bacteriophage [Enterococcus casseliflavus]
MGLLKKIGIHLDRKFRDTINDNVDIANREFDRLDQKDKYIDARVSNIVLDADGDKENEVVDARVNWQGDRFVTLQDRLVDYERRTNVKIEDQDDRQDDFALSLARLENLVSSIYGGTNGVLDIYVSASRGNNNSADGSETRPWATIQAAVNSIPLISLSIVNVWIDDGVYLEDVVLSNIQGTNIFIRTIQHVDNLNLETTDLPVKVRSIAFMYCSGYFQIFGIQFVDQVNTPVWETQQIAVMNEQGGYLSVTRCKFAEDTRQVANFRATYTGGNSKMTVNNTFFRNQHTVHHAKLLSESRFNAGNFGTGNGVTYRAEAATIRVTDNSIQSTTQTQVVAQGLIVLGGQILT